MSSDRQRSLREFIVFSVALFLMILLVGGVAFMFSMRHIIRANKGEELSRILELERVKLETSVNEKIAVIMKMAKSPLLVRYFINSENGEVKSLALDEIGSYRRVLSESVFWINDTDKLFYFDDKEPYVVDPESPDNYWYYMTLYRTHTYNFNINYNPDINMINLWINAPVFDHRGKPVGIVGSGLDVSAFVRRLYEVYSGRADLYFFNAKGEITGARDVDLVVAKMHIDKKLAGAGSDNGLLTKARRLNPGETRAFDTPIGKVAVGTVPALGWYSAAVMPDSIDDYKNPVSVVFIVMLAVMALVIVIFNVFIGGFLKSQRKTMRSLERASKYKSDFLAAMSHEIRTPMNAIIGISQIGLQRENLSKEHSDDLKRIYCSGNSLLGIVNDILDMSKIETGKLGLNPEEYDTPSLIHDAVQLNIVRIGSKPVEFELDVQEGLPLRLFGDGQRLRQVLCNLLSNAFKYTEKGCVKLTVRHKVAGSAAIAAPDKTGAASGILLQFIVEDTGQGMKPEDHKLLFTEYQRFNTAANRSKEGTGLGLNISKKLVEMMDGTIGAESEYGKGSKFTVTVRQEQVSDVVIGADTARLLREFKFEGDKRATAKLRIVRSPMPYGRVLVVDDVDTNLYVAQGLLSPYRLKVETADSGFAAIGKVTSGGVYDVIFMDHMMPGMDGIEAVQKIRASGYSGAIVALTANALAGNAEMFAEKGFDGFISKPIDVSQLNDVLNKFVRDTHPEEAQRWRTEVAMCERTGTIDPKIVKVFCRDAKNIIPLMREAIAAGDMKLFTIKAHAMKPVLAGIREHEMSERAFELEKAGEEGNTEFIGANAENFINDFEALIKKLSPDTVYSVGGADTADDVEFLKEQLQNVVAACEEYSRRTALAALDRLEEKQWKPQTADALEKIRDALFVAGDFEEAGEQAKALLEKEKNL